MIAVPSRSLAFPLSNTRLDVRTEEELFWRWHYADGEARGLRSNWADSRWSERVDSAEMRCGPVYVPAGQHRYPEYEADLSGMRAYHRMQRIDSALSRCDAYAVTILRRAFADRPDAELLFLCPITVRGPALCNLVEMTAAADREWRASRTVKPYRAWLARLAAKAAAGNGDVRLRRELTTAATILLAGAGREYARWRRLGR
jgi:hypothetical protein